MKSKVKVEFAFLPPNGCLDGCLLNATAAVLVQVRVRRSMVSPSGHEGSALYAPHTELNETLSRSSARVAKEKENVTAIPSFF
jgi:hypothetical protein